MIRYRLTNGSYSFRSFIQWHPALSIHNNNDSTVVAIELDHVAEAANAQDFPNATVGDGTNDVSIVEAANAQDFPSAAVNYVGLSVAETASASDSPNAGRTLPVVVSESVTSTDSYQSNQNLVGAVSESANALDNVSVTANFVGGISVVESSNAEDFVNALSGAVESQHIAEVIHSIGNTESIESQHTIEVVVSTVVLDVAESQHAIEVVNSQSSDVWMTQSAVEVVGSDVFGAALSIFTQEPVEVVRSGTAIEAAVSQIVLEVIVPNNVAAVNIGSNVFVAG